MIGDEIKMSRGDATQWGGGQCSKSGSSRAVPPWATMCCCPLLSLLSVLPFCVKLLLNQ